MARESRLDLAYARAQANVRAQQLGVVNWTRWLGELELGYEKERESGGGSLAGPSLAWEVPLFNQHQDDLLRADTELQIALNEVRRVTTDVDNSVYLAYASVKNARARVAQYRDVLIPQRVEAVASAQRELNYMLIGAFELVDLKQEEYDAQQGYLEAIRDYWLARADLGLATGTGLPSSATIDGQDVNVESLTEPAHDQMDHSGHTMSHEMNDGGSM
jgi:outer membrane protein, heavy metal efflux system